MKAKPPSRKLGKKNQEFIEGVKSYCQLSALHVCLGSEFGHLHV